MFRNRAQQALLVLLVGLVGSGILGLTGCQGSAGSGAPTMVAPTSTVATVATTSTVPPTTVYQPSAPQPSQDLAGAHLIAAWKAGDRATALTDATTAAVDALFAETFPAGGVQARGCSVPAAGPSTCVYRVLANERLLSLSAEARAGGWFVSAARFQG